MLRYSTQILKFRYVAVACVIAVLIVDWRTLSPASGGDLLLPSFLRLSWELALAFVVWNSVVAHRTLRSNGGAGNLLVLAVPATGLLPLLYGVLGAYEYDGYGNPEWGLPVGILLTNARGLAWLFIAGILMLKQQRPYLAAEEPSAELTVEDLRPH